VSVRIGIDTGGTFTDFVRLDEGGLIVHKRRTSPTDPAEAILAGLAELAPDASTAAVVHGSTIATNAVLERRGARVALAATSGFEDIIRIGRQTRPQLYNFFVQGPRPIVDPALTFGVTERMNADGRAQVPVDIADVERLGKRLSELGVEIVAVCLLHSYANPLHERQVARRLARSGLAVSMSAAVLPEYREYERWSTTVVNAYVGPLVERYLGRLRRALGRRRLSIMQSNGGSISAAAARSQPVRTVLSGPAAGVVGARTVAAAAGISRLISFDMGGTSTDVSLVDGEIATTAESTIGDFPVRLPVLDIHTVGAGGGSIARVDAGGALRVGPLSAGAVPGPACYGAGTNLTVTDANLLLGRLDPDAFLGGRMRLDLRRAHEAAAVLGAQIGLSVPELAEGVLRVANAGMERAIRVVSVERGHDPRRFALVAFGGAGGMHACEIAAELGMARVIVPRHAGVLSALGMLVADVTRDYSATVLRASADLTHRDLVRRFDPLVTTALRALRADGFGPRRRVIARRLDVRYVGQSHEITVDWSPRYQDTFHRAHAGRYGYADPVRPTEVVAIRVVASGLTPKPSLPFDPPRRRRLPPPAAIRDARFAGRAWRTVTWRWEDLLSGVHGAGPAVIAGAEATVVVPPDFRFGIDGFRNVVLTRRRSARRLPAGTRRRR
jgi:N-methylhydantoinase A/oxoprolinase/acetone carboxylase beta subunit